MGGIGPSGCLQVVNCQLQGLKLDFFNGLFGPYLFIQEDRHVWVRAFDHEGVRLWLVVQYFQF